CCIVLSLLFSILFPYTTLFRSDFRDGLQCPLNVSANACSCPNWMDAEFSYGDNSSFFQNSHLSPVRSCSVLLILVLADQSILPVDRKSTRLNSSHGSISYAVFC